MHSNDVILDELEPDMLLSQDARYIFDVEIDSPDIDSHQKMFSVFKELMNCMDSKSIFLNHFKMSDVEAHIPEYAEEDCRVSFYMLDNQGQDLEVFSRLFLEVSAYRGIDYTVSVIDYDLETPVAKCRQFQGGKETKHLSVNYEDLVVSGLLDKETFAHNLFIHSDEVQRYFGLK